MGGHHSRHHSVGDFDPMRSHSAANLQNFYANQRFQPRHTEAEQMQQAKRRMAAQRERELRNYHQEQQYHRSMCTRTCDIGMNSGADHGARLEVSAQGKTERSISPNAMNEEDRRELIARQHRALYGADSASFYNAPFGDDNSTPRPTNPAAQGAPGQAPSGPRQSPLSYNAFGMPSEHLSGMDNSNQYALEQTTKGPSPKQPQPTRSRANSTASPASNTQNHSVFDNAAQQSSRTSTSSPGGSPPRPGNKNGVAPIGTRPQQPAPAGHAALQKRSTTPLPSPLSYGFAPDESQNTMPATSLANERSTSAASNPTANNPKENISLNWGSSSGVWGKNSLGVQASVWG